MSPQIRLRPATAADISTIVDIHNDSFGPGIMNRLMYPHGPSASDDAQFGASLRTMLETPPSRAKGDVRVFLAELDGEVVAFALWTVFREARPREEWDVVSSMTPPGEGGDMDLAVYEAFIGDLLVRRKDGMRGDPTLLLRMLCCRTKRHRMGAGSALLRWGVELADREGLVAWLEASPEGYRAYEKFGFRPVDVQDLRVTERWGATRRPDEDWGRNSAVAVAGELPEGVFRTAMMKRLPVRD